MKTSIFADFAVLYPDRFTNITNGVTPRRWINIANRPPNRIYLLANWRTHLEKLSVLNEKMIPLFFNN